MSTLVRSFFWVRPCLAASKFIENRYCSTSTTLKYESTEVFLKTAKEHLSKGDIAPCCTKLFGSVTFALRSYVDELARLHSMTAIDSAKWDYSKYRKLCTLISKSFDKNEKIAFMNGWRGAEQLHILGWKLNQVEYDDASIGLISVEQFVQKIADLPKDKELSERIYMEIFGFDEASIAQKIRKHINTKNHRQVLLCFGIKMKYNQQQREEIIKAYNEMYKSDLRKELKDILFNYHIL